MGRSLPDLWHHRRELAKSVLSDPYSKWHRVHFINTPGHIIYIRILSGNVQNFGEQEIKHFELSSFLKWYDREMA